MKSLLNLRVASLAALFSLLPALPSLAQAPAASPTPTPIPIATGTAPAPKAPSAPKAPASAGNAHEAAAAVPLPGQSPGPSLEKNIPLIPEPPAPASRHGGGKAQASSSPHEFATFQVEHDIRMRIHLRELQTRVWNQPAIQADWAAAHHAATDPQRRALLAVYFNHLYDGMIKLDPTIAQRVNLRRQAVIERMKYTRLSDSDNSENPFVAPTPIPSGVNPPAQESEDSVSNPPRS
jgi:hypothetical protein